MDNFTIPVSHANTPFRMIRPEKINLDLQDFGMELANPLHSDNVLNDFDFDSFLNDGDANNEPFDFNGGYPGLEGGEIGAE